jgi:polysaccharide export outer membrane protein
MAKAQILDMSQVLVVLVGALLGVGCATAQPRHQVLPEVEATSSALAQVNSVIAAAAARPHSSTEYKIGAEDLLRITLSNILEGENGKTTQTIEEQVSQRGTITLPLLEEDMEVTGLTPIGLEEKLRERYEEYVYNPRVWVSVKEYRSQQVSVIGAVEKPGVFTILGPMTLIDALAEAGGVSENAGGQIHVYRQGPEGRESLVLDLYAIPNNTSVADLPLQAGDVINVPVAGTFFIDGAVGSPGTYVNRRYTLTQALTVAGGVEMKPAKYSEITIFRRNGHAQVEKMIVDLDKIRAGEETDLLVQADDVILVPSSFTKLVFRRLFGEGLGIGVSAPIGAAGFYGGNR